VTYVIVEVETGIINPHRTIERHEGETLPKAPRIAPARRFG
jgi:hypothetical protein